MLVLHNGFLLREESVDGILCVASMQCLLMVLREPFPIVCKLGERLLELLIFALFVGSGRGFDQTAVFEGFGAILLRGEHEWPF